MNIYYTATGAPTAATRGLSAALRNEYLLVQAAFDAITISPAFTGTPTAPTAAAGANTTQVANMLAVNAAIARAGLSSSLPPLTGNGGMQLLTDGAAITWGRQFVRSARTSNTLLANTDSGKLIDVTSGTFAQTFDASANLKSGWSVFYKNSGTGVVTLTPNGVETIDGLATLNLYQGQTAIVHSDGSVLRTTFVSGRRIVTVRHEQASGTGPGFALSASTYVTRTLNTVSHNSVSGASLASNLLTVPAGKYRVSASAIGVGTNGHRIRLWDTTANALLLLGTDEYSSNTSNVQTRSSIEGGVIALTQATAIRMDHWAAVGAGTTAGSAISTGDVEVYAVLSLERID